MRDIAFTLTAILALTLKFACRCGIKEMFLISIFLLASTSFRVATMKLNLNSVSEEQKKLQM